MRIRTLKNFGYAGENVAPATELEVDPEEFGGTYPDFLRAGFFEEIGSREQGTGSWSKPTPEGLTEPVSTETEAASKPGSSSVPSSE